jgi:transposase
MGAGEGRTLSGTTEFWDTNLELRTMLVQGAHYILGPFGEDSDLRRWGLKLAARGGKNAKKRAVVAVARKLAVLLHRLWVSGEVYEPLRNSQKVMRAVA